MPKSGKSFPVVLVVQEIFGVHEQRNWAIWSWRRSSTHGRGDVSKLTNMQDVISKVSKVPDAQVMSNLDAAVDWAGKAGKGDTGRVGHHWFLLGRGPSYGCMLRIHQS